MFRDDYIEFDIPNEWTFDECPIEKQTFDDYELEEVIEAYSNDSELYMELFYISESMPDAEGNYYMGNELTALEYYDKYGEKLIESLFTEYWAIKNISISEPVYSSGEWENYIRIDVEYMEGEWPYKDRIYMIANDYSASETMVHSLIICDSGDIDFEESTETFWEIADGFDDYEYGRVVAGLDTIDEDWEPGEDDGEDDGGILEMILTIGGPIIVIIISALIKKETDDDEDDEVLSEEEKMDKPSQDTLDKISNLLRQKEAEQSERKIAKQQKSEEKKARKKREKPQLFKKPVDDRKILIERSAKPGQARKPVPVRTSAPRTQTAYHQQAEQRYITSLETLRKSGLLTKEEMQEMLDKHRRI